ncbi:MAG: tyrosine-type recombinase/integrase, partial [Rhodoferax sp.]|nr:tyrosine-type recombinase/integrase [Rhodoferax sp.]
MGTPKLASACFMMDAIVDASGHIGKRVFVGLLPSRSVPLQFERWFANRQVLGMDLPWMQQIGRPSERKRIPVVLTQDEIQRVLSMMAGEEAVLAKLLYGAGLRLNEGLSLRVKDLDFDRHAAVVRSGKGDKDRVVMLPRSLVAPLHEQLARSKALWTRDRATEVAGVFLPHALERKYPRAGQSWAWHWVFPSTDLARQATGFARQPTPIAQCWHAGTMKSRSRRLFPAIIQNRCRFACEGDVRIFV